MKAIRRMDDFKTRDGRHEDLSGYEETDIYGATEGRSPFRLSGKRAASGSLIQEGAALRLLLLLLEILGRLFGAADQPEL